MTATQKMFNSPPRDIESPATIASTTGQGLTASRLVEPISPAFRSKNPDILPVTKGMSETQLELIGMSPVRRSPSLLAERVTMKAGL